MQDKRKTPDEPEPEEETKKIKLTELVEQLEQAKNGLDFEGVDLAILKRFKQVTKEIHWRNDDAYAHVAVNVFHQQQKSYNWAEKCEIKVEWFTEHKELPDEAIFNLKFGEKYLGVNFRWMGQQMRDWEIIAHQRKRRFGDEKSGVDALFNKLPKDATLLLEQRVESDRIQIHPPLQSTLLEGLDTICGYVGLDKRYGLQLLTVILSILTLGQFKSLPPDLFTMTKEESKEITNVFGCSVEPWLLGLTMPSSWKLMQFASYYKINELARF